MLKQGPVPVLVHGVLEYIVGVLFIAAPFLFGFESNSATAAAIVVGLLLLAFTATSALPTGLVSSITVGVHVTVDLVFAVLLVALPFVLGFRDEAAPTALFIVVGVLHLLVTIATRFSREEEELGDVDGPPGAENTAV
jgi:VIT1/CCC1 family predicted Fe2+/Mn2+ transporter